MCEGGELYHANRGETKMVIHVEVRRMEEERILAFGRVVAARVSPAVERAFERVALLGEHPPRERDAHLRPPHEMGVPAEDRATVLLYLYPELRATADIPADIRTVWRRDGG